MLDRHLEPDFDIEFRCECGECESCCKGWEIGFDAYEDAIDTELMKAEQMDEAVGDY